MNQAELINAVTGKCSVEPQAVQKVLESAFAILAEEMAREDKVEIQGLGTFVRRQRRKSGQPGKTLFMSWSPSGTSGKKGRAAKAKKRARKSARKRKNENSP